MQKKTLISLFFLVIVIMFSFPWITISCAGQPIMNATGFQLTSGNYGMSPQDVAYLGINATKATPNIWLILVLILSGIGFVVGLTMGEKIAYKISAWLSSITSVILIVFRVAVPTMARSSAGSDEFDAAMSQLIQLHFEPGFYFAVIFAIGCAFLNFYAMGGLKEKKLPINISNRSSGPVPDESDFILCSDCGTRNPITNKYCSKCGVRLPERRE